MAINGRNFLPHVALAAVLILIAAFAGQVRRWQKEWSSIRVVPGPTEAEQRAEHDFVERDHSLHRGRAEVLVKFRPGITTSTIDDITSGFNDQTEDSIESVPGLWAIDDLDDSKAEAIAEQYRALPEVEYAEPNYEISLNHTGGGAKHLHPEDPRFLDQWGLSNEGQKGGLAGADIKAMEAWATTTGSEKVVIAVLDSGVAYDHEDLVNNMWRRPEQIMPYADRDFGVVEDDHGYNAIDNSGDPYDQNGHGTHCAGIIGAEGGNRLGITGVNWKIKIMPLKFMNAGGFGSTKDAIEAINYVIDRRKAGVNVRVISASWGSTLRSRALEEVISRANAAGILFVAAAGNATSDNDRKPHFPASYSLPNVVSVAATDRNDAIASFSNYGANTVHLAAPGKEILSTWLGNDYEEHSGTSMATPVVAGVAALIVSSRPDVSVEGLRRALLETVDKSDALRGKVATGGRINAARALAAR